MQFAAILARSDNYMYLFYDDTHAMSFDPFDPTLIDLAPSKKLNKEFYTKETLQAEGSHPKRILLYNFTTHSHYDHCGGNHSLAKMHLQLKFVSKFENNAQDLDNFFNGQVIAISTPCHTMDSMCYLVDDRYLVTGDTLFKLGCGKFFEGTAADMKQSFDNIIRNVKRDVILLYGHDYNFSNLKFAKLFKEIPEEICTKRFLTLGEELQFNPFLSEMTEKQLQELRTKKNNFT